MIVIAGYGYVGKAIDEALSQHEHVEIVDPMISLKRVYDFDAVAVIIAVSTPEATDGSCNMQNVFSVLADVPKDVPVLIKSTISIDGWRELNAKYPDHKITFSPEFLRANTAIQDFQNQHCLFLGGGDHKYWEDLFLTTIKKPSKIVEAESLILAKLFRNSFLATKVTFFNQVNDLCEVFDIDYEQVRSVIADDQRIGNSHTEVTDERGFGGHCFPKDTEALVTTALQHGCSMSLIKEAIRYNKKIRKSIDK